MFFQNFLQEQHFTPPKSFPMYTSRKCTFYTSSYAVKIILSKPCVIF